MMSYGCDLRFLFLFGLVFLLQPQALAGNPPKKGATPQRDTAGEVVSVAGVAFVRPDGRIAQDKITPAKSGDLVHVGDVINTSSNGKIKVLMKDRSIVDLGPSALFKVEQFKKNAGSDREVDVSMMYGTLRTAVTEKLTGKGKFRVRTPSATMGVRGTEFIVKSEVKSLEQIRQVILNPDKPIAPTTPEPQAVGAKGTAPAKAESTKTEITVLQGKVDVAKKEEVKRGPAGSPKAVPQVVSLTAGNQLITKQGEAAPLKAVTLDTKQLANLTKEAKVIDNTFSKAVVIDTSAFQDSGAGEATRTIMSSAIAVSVPSAPAVSVADIGFAGTFGSNQALSRPPANQTPGAKRIRVTIVRE